VSQKGARVFEAGIDEAEAEMLADAEQFIAEHPEALARLYIGSDARAQFVERVKALGVTIVEVPHGRGARLIYWEEQDDE
jgi:hypothetical protein